MPPYSEIIEDEDDQDLAQEIEAQVNEWSSSSNECFTVQLVREDGSVAASFQPEFTYAMFGNEEAIFGYQDLSITLTFAAHDMSPQLDIRYDKIFETQGEVAPTDIKEALQEYLPASAFEDEAAATETTDFTPPGEKIHEYKRNGRTFAIWCSSLANPAARQLLENMQILVPMFIDGGSMLELEQDWTTARWKIFLVYEVDASESGPASPYTLAGYATSYRVFTFPERQKTIQFDDFSPTTQTLDHFLPSPDNQANAFSHPPDLDTPLELPSRERLSQFLMLPPYHGAGHGQELYQTMYKHLTSSPKVREFTVEDPNERFDDLRDFCDLLHLRADVPEFANLRINADIAPDQMGSTMPIPVDLIVPAGVRKQIMRDTKIMPRQFDRLVEMHTLSFIPLANRSRSRITRKEKTSNSHDRQYYFWRLYVKQRLYIFNKDQLSQVEHFERVQKLESALDSVQEAYAEMIDKVEAREKALADGELDSAAATASRAKRKRPVVPDEDEDEDDDDDDDDDGEAAAEQERAPVGQKKLRVG